MTFDIFTTLAASSAVVFILGFTILLFWVRNKKADWLVCWGSAFLVLAVGNILVMSTRVLPDFVTHGLGNSVTILGFGLVWQATRKFEGKAIALTFPIASATLWFVLFFVPAIGDNGPLRVIITSMLMSGLLILGARELWQGRAVKLPSRSIMMSVFVLMAVAFCARVPLAHIAPYPVGALPVDPAWVAGFNCFLTTCAILTTASLISMMLERAEIGLKELAETDPLTGLLNRRAFDKVFADSAVTDDTAVIMFDIDHFKRINDVHGHATGDKLLQCFAEVCRENVRQIDSVARMGGEEFVAVLPRTDAASALRVAERIRKSFAQQQIQSASGPVSCTVSAGIEIIEAQSSKAIEKFLAQADHALYCAKESGRNRVCVSSNRAVA